MSLYGAMRMFIVAGRHTDDRTPAAGADEELTPIQPGAWKAWAWARALEDSRADDARPAARPVSPSLRPAERLRSADGEVARGATSARTGIEPL